MLSKIAKLFDLTFWKFIIVGVANTIVGTAVMFLFYNILGFSYWVSSASNYVVGSVLSYVLNRIFTFRNEENTNQTLPKFIINISVCYLLAYGCAKPLISYLLKGSAKKMQENIAMFVGMCLFVAFNYVGQRFFVFKSLNESGEK